MSSRIGKPPIRSAAWRISLWATLAFAVGTTIVFVFLQSFVAADIQRRTDAWLAGEVGPERGGREPLGPVLQECVATILQQVTLLRQIASEFSSFASSPTAKRAAVDVAEMLREILEPYRRGHRCTGLPAARPD